MTTEQLEADQRLRDRMTPDDRHLACCWYFRCHLGKLRRAAWGRMLAFKRLPRAAEADHLLRLYYDESFLDAMHRTFGGGRAWVVAMVRARRDQVLARARADGAAGNERRSMRSGAPVDEPASSCRALGVGDQAIVDDGPGPPPRADGDDERPPERRPEPAIHAAQCTAPRETTVEGG